MLLVTLGMCVFLWGLAYKMSLYEAHQASIQRIPEAKLLSRNEDPNTAADVRVCLPNSDLSWPGPPFADGVNFLSNSDLPKRKAAASSLEAKQPSSLLVDASLTAFFFRPPPSLRSL
jgi:hypothetical protein